MSLSGLRSWIAACVMSLVVLAAAHQLLGSQLAAALPRLARLGGGRAVGLGASLLGAAVILAGLAGAMHGGPRL